jgi:hypothetical protein
MDSHLYNSKEIIEKSSHILFLNQKSEMYQLPHNIESKKILNSIEEIVPAMRERPPIQTNNLATPVYAIQADCTYALDALT